MLGRTNRRIVQVLQSSSEVLVNMQQDFHTMLDDMRRNEGRNIEIFCFYEELAVLGVGKVSTGCTRNSHLHYIILADADWLYRLSPSVPRS
jgi:hypothetical protein